MRQINSPSEGIPTVGGATPMRFPQNPIPTIRFLQGKRKVFLLVPHLDQVKNLATPPEKYDPVNMNGERVGRNRPTSRPHILGIQSYLLSGRPWVLGSLTAVVKPDSLRFTALVDFGDDVAIGYTEVERFEEVYDVTDGGHRVPAIDGALTISQKEDSQHWRELVRSGIPVMVVEETSPAQAGLDFAALASTKPISSSLREALNVDNPVNHFALDLSQSIRLLRDGELVEYLGASVGANSDKLITFASFKFAVSVMIVGRRFRTPRRQDEAVVDELRNGGFAKWKLALQEFFEYAAEVLPGWHHVVSGELSAAEARNSYLTCSAAGIGALAIAMYEVLLLGDDRRVQIAVDHLATLNWSRGPDSVFAGTLLNEDPKRPGTYIVAAGRPAFEAAADRLIDSMVAKGIIAQASEPASLAG